MNKILLTLLMTTFGAFGATGQAIYSLPVIYTDYQLVIADIDINGITVKALFDTGNFSEFRVSSDLVKRMNLVQSATSQSNTTLENKKSAVSRVLIGSLTVGDLNIKSVQADCIDQYIETISKRINTPIDVIVGWPFFEKYYCEFDLKNSLFRFSPGAFRTGKPEFKLPFKTVNRCPVIQVRMADAEAALLFDTGAPFCRIDSTFNAGLAKDFTSVERPFGAYTIPFISRKFVVNGQSLEAEFFVSDTRATRCQGIIGNNFLVQYRICINPVEKIIELIDN